MKYSDTLHLNGVTALKGFDNLAAKCENNIVQITEKLGKQAVQIQRQEKRLESLERPSVMARMFSGLRQRSIQSVLEKYTHDMEKWKQMAGTSYPEVQKDDGKTVHYDVLKREVAGISRDGFYHIPKEEIKTVADRTYMKNISEMPGIPYTLGKELENIWNRPGYTYVHATPIAPDHFRTLGAIAHQGLACNGDSIAYTAFEVKSLPQFIHYVCASNNYHQGQCQAAIILKAEHEPEVKDGVIDPKYLAGYVSNKDGVLQGFANKDALLHMNATEYRIREAMQPLFPEDRFWISVIQDQNNTRIHIDEKVHSGFHQEFEMRTEEILSDEYMEKIQYNCIDYENGESQELVTLEEKEMEIDPEHEEIDRDTETER